MGYIKHDAVIVTTSVNRPGGLPDIDAFRESLDPRFRHLVIGPVKSAVNADVTYAFLPDGSKEGWPESDYADAAREQFKDLFRQRHIDGSTADDWVHVVYGGDAKFRPGDEGSLVEVWRTELLDDDGRPWPRPDCEPRDLLAGQDLSVISVRFGSEVRVDVPGVVVAPGLALVRPIVEGSPKHGYKLSDRYYNVTHVGSGSSIVRYLCGRHAEQVVADLTASGVDWTGDLDDPEALRAATVGAVMRLPGGANTECRLEARGTP